MEKTAVIIVAYNSSGTISNCLSSLKNFSGDVILVDNNSEDDTLRKVQAFKKVKVIKSDVNLGFSKGCNLGAQSTQAEILIFLNPDTKIISKDFRERVVEDLRQDKVGIVGPKFIYPDGKIQRTARNFPTVLNAFKEYVLNIKGSYDFTFFDKAESVQVVIGACLCIKSSIFKKVGGFNEEFFLYYEDIDLCSKVKKLGAEVLYDPEILVEHVVGVSGKGKPVSALLVQSAKKYHGFFEYHVIQLIIRIGQKLHG